MEYLNPDEVANFNVRYNKGLSDYQNALSKFSFESGQAGLDYGLGKAALTTQWDRTRQALPGQYMGRGLGYSGIYGGALQDYGADRTSAFQGFQRQYDRQIGDINQQRQGLEGSWAVEKNAIEAQKQARRATLASQLRGMG